MFVAVGNKYDDDDDNYSLSRLIKIYLKFIFYYYYLFFVSFFTV